MPGETIVVTGGILASFGVLDLPETLAAAVAGALAGDNAGYWLGRRLGRPWLEQHGRRIGVHVAMLARIDELFERHGGKAVLIGRFVGFLRAMAPFAAGSARMPYLTFALYNAAGATTWGIGFVLLGYFLGSSWHLVQHWLGGVGAVIGLIVLAAAVAWLKRGARRRTTRRGRDGSG
jgi:undecaprenyl-diphosphatase